MVDGVSQRRVPPTAVADAESRHLVRILAWDACLGRQLSGAGPPVLLVFRPCVVFQAGVLKRAPASFASLTSGPPFAFPGVGLGSGLLGGLGTSPLHTGGVTGGSADTLGDRRAPYGLASRMPGLTTGEGEPAGHCWSRGSDQDLAMSSPFRHR